MKRLIAATLLGIAVSAVVLFARLLFWDPATFAIIEARFDGWTEIKTFGFILFVLLAAGGIPAVLIGAVLMLFRRAWPVTLVFTPGALFLLILIEVARETHDATLIHDCLPAMLAGGAVMFAWLSRRAPIPQPVEATFE
jgi:hypothetical protein